MSPAGYSGKPLAAKLGYRAGDRVHVKGAPASYARDLVPLPEDVTFLSRLTKDLDLVHVFTKRRSELEAFLARARQAIRPAGAIWVSWPKKASKVATDVTEDTVRELAFPLDLVDVKVCAVDDVWSGLKVVIRKEKR